MKVWVMTNEYEPYIIGGLGIVASRLSQGLAEDLEVTVLAKSSRKEVQVSEEKGLRLIRFPRNHPSYFSVFRQKFHYLTLARWLEEHDSHRPDLIHIHSVEYTYLAKYYKRKYSIPVVYTCHSLVLLEKKSKLRQLVAKRQQKLLQAADCIVVPSEWEKQQLHEVHPMCQGKVHVIENGVQVKDQPSSTSRRHDLLFVGRLIRLKGIEELLHAVAMLSRSEPRVKLSVVGTGAPAYVDYLKRLTHRLGIASKVRWLGYLEPNQVQYLYGRYGAVIVPSKQESFGLVALEALANGVPLVSTRSGGLGDFVTADVAQVIYSLDGAGIAAAVKRLWADKDLTAQRIAEGIKRAANYDWGSIAGRYRDLFSNILSDGEEETEWSEADGI